MNANATHDLDELVVRARLGDMGAFGEIAGRMQRLLVGYAASRLNRVSAAEDVVQEALIAAYRALPDLRRVEVFPTWLRSIVARKCVRENASTRPEIPNPETVASPSSVQPGEIAERQEQRESVRSAIANLPTPQREVVCMYYLDGVRQPDIAAFLDLPLSTIKKRLHDARARLKGMLANEEVMKNEQLIRDQFRHVLSSALVQRLVTSPAMAEMRGEERELTVLFSDVDGMTGAFARMSPRDAVTYINEYFEAMADVILAHEGLVDKLIGDEIMALWGAPVASVEHAHTACEAALAMRRALDQLNRGWRRQGLPTLDTRVWGSTRVRSSSATWGIADVCSTRQLGQT